MRRWSFEEIVRRLDEAIGNVDPDDPRGKKRLKILQAATSLFLRQGYKKTSVGEVAAEAGVAKGTVYLYFATKIELWIAAVAIEKREFIERMRPVFSNELEPRARLKQFLVNNLVMAQEMPLISRMLADNSMMAMLSEIPPELMADNQAMGLDLVSEMVEDLVGKDRWNSVEREDRAKVLIGLGSFASLIANAQLRNGLSVKRYATILADTIVNGLTSSGGDLSEGEGT